MALQVEIWAPDIKEFLIKDNEFINTGTSQDDNVLAGKVVHKPQSGGAAAVVRNRASYPATVVLRSDTDLTYEIDEYTTDPFHIPHKDTVELSYDKRMSMLQENAANLKEVLADNLAYSWAKNVPGGKKIDTTGAANAGGFKRLTKEDFIRAQNVLNNDNVPKDMRYMLITADQLADLLADTTLTGYFQSPVNLEEGVIARMFGFNLMMRSSVITMTSGKVVKLPEAAAAGGDISGAIFYQKQMVERAWGDIKLFENTDDPTYYGDIYSLLVRFGGRNVRADNKGVGILCSVTA